MQIRIDETKNIAKFLCFNSDKASNPNAFETSNSPESFPFGGVLGRKKL